jgi:hypothetical protein
MKNVKKGIKLNLKIYYTLQESPQNTNIKWNYYWDIFKFNILITNKK